MNDIEPSEQDETPSTNGDNGRLSNGRFAKGNPGGPGNPQARNVATWRQALAETVSPEDVAEVTRQMIKAAKAGEPWAVREFFDRCLGKPHVQIELQGDMDDDVREFDERTRTEAIRLARLSILGPEPTLPMLEE